MQVAGLAKANAPSDVIAQYVTSMVCSRFFGGKAVPDVVVESACRTTCTLRNVMSAKSHREGANPYKTQLFFFPRFPVPFLFLSS